MLLKFINRERELRLLEERWRSGKPELILVYGRRRVGKTALLKRFMDNKAHFYFLAKKKGLEEERERFRMKFSKDFNMFLPPAASWDELFGHMAAQTRGRLVVVIDEFPYWVEKDKSILSDFQHLWDETLQRKDITLVLCGSAVSVMEHSVLGYASPLYGRRTAQLEVGKLGFLEFCRFFPHWTVEERMRAYGALDGIPLYIREFDPALPLEKNIEQTFWRADSVLNREVDFLLSQELREAEVYAGILRAIFEGATKLHEIADKSNVQITNINKYLKVLVDLKFLALEQPVLVTRPKRKTSLYKLADNFLSFWLSYVYPFKDDIAVGETGRLKEFFSADYSRYLGYVFEKVCLQLIRELPLPIKPSKIGRWWEKGTEIDLVCLDETSRQALFMECKWSTLTEREARAVLTALKIKAAAVTWERGQEYFGLFGKNVEGKEKLRREGFAVFDLMDVERLSGRKHVSSYTAA